MELSVIIPCCNAARTIGIQLEAFSKQTWSEPWEVIISDNGSIDNTVAIAEQYKKHLSNLQIIDSSDKKGSGYARNAGASVARGELLAFCDADDEVAFGWVKAIGEALSKHDLVASRFDTTKLNSSPLGRVRKNPQLMRAQKLWYPPYLLHSGGSGLGVKRSVHEAVGGFDERLPRLVDTDYCLRIQLAGWKLHFVPNALVFIRHRDTFSGVFYEARLWAKYNTFLYKNYRPLGMYICQPWTCYFKRWLHFFRSMLNIRSKTDLGMMIWKLGWQIGLLQGSIRFRVAPAVPDNKKPLYLGVA